VRPRRPREDGLSRSRVTAYALALPSVSRSPETAAAHGIAESTVKAHLGNLCVKTDTGRHADLVKIVAGFATPLAG
jgi:hypothetical protein